MAKLEIQPLFITKLIGQFVRVDKDDARAAGLKTVDFAIEICKSCLESHGKVGINFQKISNERVTLWLGDWLDIFVGHGHNIEYKVAVERVVRVSSIEFDDANNAVEIDEEPSFERRTFRLFISGSDSTGFRRVCD